MSASRICEAAGNAPASGRGVVELGAVERMDVWTRSATPSSRDQDLAIGKQCRRMEAARHVEAAGGNPVAGDAPGEDVMVLVARRRILSIDGARGGKSTESG